jgi:integrase
MAVPAQTPRPSAAAWSTRPVRLMLFRNAKHSRRCPVTIRFALCIGGSRIPSGLTFAGDQRSGGEMPNVRRKYLSPDEARRLIEAAGRIGRQGARDKLLVVLMFCHGLRLSEVIDLRWTHFDLDAPRDRPFYVRRLKGSKETVHTLEPIVCVPLRRARMTSGGQYVFRSERGGPLSADTIQAIVARAGRVAGLASSVTRTHVAPCLWVLPC